MRRLKLSLGFSVVLLSAVAGSAADEPLAPAQQRFADPKSEETPDFQRHVVPLLGKLGCNGRACHGSFQGQGGFRLSLFGYDFKMDYEGLSERIDTGAPADSYALHKPTLQEEHEGGKRMDIGSWEYNILLNWIKAGANPVEKQAPSLLALDVTPAEVVFSSSDEKTQLRVIARWSDGSAEDVTCLSRFQSNDTQIVTIDPRGELTSGDPGDSHVVVFYDNGVVPIPVMRPVSDLIGERYPEVATPSEVDRLVVDKLRKVGIVPSEGCSDAEFLRRVSLDITGTLPTADEVRQFLKDESPDKRERKIDELLETPAYAAWWAQRLCDITGNSDEQLVNVTPERERAGQDWYGWIHKRVAENVPYDELVSGLVVSTSRREGESYRDYCERVSQWYHRDGKDEFSSEPSMPHYWARRNFRTAEERAVGFAYSFLAVRIECAQCHKHPFDQWTQDDFQQFQGFFEVARFSNTGSDRDEYNSMMEDLGLADKRGNDARREFVNLLRDGKTVPMPELYVQRPRVSGEALRRAQAARRQGKKVEDPEVTAKLLGSDVVNLAKMDDPREALMDWLRSADNPLFARAFVNRVWAAYFNRGIVQPTDDLSLANPPSNEPLLTYLAEGFVASGYDMKWVHRTIANSRTYQTSWRPNETNLHDERNFSRAVPRRLPAEVAYDAMQMCTSDDKTARSFVTDMDDRAIAEPSVPRGNARYTGTNYPLYVFGKSIRENNCDCERTPEPSLLQTIFLRNDEDLFEMIDRRNDGWLAEVVRENNLSSSQRRQVTPERPANYDEVVARMEKQITRLRRQDNKDALAKAEKQLREYRRKYRDSDESQSPTVASLDAEKTRQIAEEAYLRTLSRFPDERELGLAAAFIQESPEPEEGIRSLLWTLMNTKEFIVNH